MKNFLRVTMLAICAIFMVANVSAQDNYDATTMGEKVYLETANWGQNSPFNKQIFTEYGGSTNAKAGCVPTAYAIVMRYHGFPEEGTAKTLYNCQAPTYVEITDRVYDFSKMPLTYNSDWTQEHIDEVSKFFSHVLHACFPSSIGTGATTVNEGSDSKVLNDYFNYQLINASYQANFTMEQWIEKIKESIDNGCPIPYASDNSGTGDTRHMFVLDGYTANNYFHFNFGWSGGSNGWFKLDDITPSQGDNYSWIDGAEHYALFNLAPNKTMRTVTASVSPAGAGTVTVNGNANSAEVMEGITATLVATANSGYTFSHWSKGGTEVGTEMTYKAKVAAEGNDYVANFYTIGSSINIPVNYDSNMGSVTYNGNIVSATGFNPNEYSEVTLTAEANDGYMFTGWEIVEGTESTESNDNTVTFIAKNGITVNANFALAGGEYKINKDNVTISGGNSSYCSTWTYTKDGDIEGILTLSTVSGSTVVNALSGSSNKLYAQAFDDNGGNESREITYTLTAKEGFVITGYSLTYVVGYSYKGEVTVRNATQSLTPNDTEGHTLTYQYANAARSSAYGTRTAEFILSSTGGSRPYITITDFSVTVLSEGAEGGSTPTPDPEPDPTPTTYAVTTTANPAAGGTAKFAVGTGSQKTQGDVENGTEITLYATANTGYNFVNWTLGGNVVSTDATCNVSVAQASNYVANFEAVQQGGSSSDDLAGKYFRLKVKNTTNYMNIANTSENTGSTSGVTVVAKNESSDTQIFLFEQSGDGYKLKANSGNYIKCHAWNANANTTSANDATVLTFETTGNELEYLIKWDNTNMNNGVERDDYFKAENGYVFCDAAIGSATTWVLEEVIPSNEKTLTVTYSGATWGNKASDSNWWEYVTTTNNPAVTVRAANEAKAIGFSTVNSVRHPYLLDGNSFTISLPSNCKITGYRLGYQAHNLVSKSVTYTNGKQSTGTLTIAQSDEQNTLTVTGLDNSEIAISVADQTTQAGFIIKSLEITYIEDTDLETYTVAVTAGENGTATASAETVAEGDNVTLTATANTDYKFVGWYNGETKVSEANPYTFAVTSNISYEARFEELFPDGAYKVYWQADNRGYLAYHATARPDEAVLADVTYTGYDDDHYNSSTDPVDLVWYLITASDGKRYLFQAATGKFLGVDTSIQANGTGNKLSTTEAWPINVEKNTYPTRLGHYIITTVINGTNSLLCSGCGTSSFNGGHSVRWLAVNDDNQKDGGAPLQLIPVNDVTVSDDIMNAVRAVIEPKTFQFKAEIENWRNNNPNTHLGTITIGGTAVKLTPAHQTASEFTMPLAEGTTLAFTRKYRGFEFNGFYIGATSLGENLTLTADNVDAIDENNPLIAKFTATDDVTLFYDDDEFSYRIPAIAKTGTNRLVAVSDYRHSHDDIGRDNHGTGTYRVDLVMRTSDDNGLTWTDKQTIAEGDPEFGYGDAAVVANGENILVMAVAGNVFYAYANSENPQQAYRIYSNDNGETWEKEDISSNMESLFPDYHGLFFGSGKLAVDPDFNGSGNARVYGAILMKDSQGERNYVLYSDNWGKTWNILGNAVAAHQNEPKVEILPNGQILLSARRNGGRTFNVFTYTDKANNAGTWSTATNGCDNGGNGTNGEIILLDAKRPNGTPTKILLQSQPYGGDRRNVSIWYKEISANETYTASSIASGWTKGKQVSTQLSAYSAMCLQENGEIALFFEEAPCHNDDHTYGYSMVYVPLTIEEITGENFLNPNAVVETVTVDVTLTDEQGNTYTHQFDYLPGDAAAIDAALKAAYPFITKLGENGNLEQTGEKAYTYTNTVTLPFKVSNANTTVWHNIYWPANTNENLYPIYILANTATDTQVAKVNTSTQYGNSQYNTLEYADKLSWAIYSVDGTLNFKLKNKVTQKYIQVTSVGTGNEKNAVYAEELEATAFTLQEGTGSRAGSYNLIAKVGGAIGYFCSTSTGNSWATHYNGSNGNDHHGAWVKFVEAPDYQAIVDALTENVAKFGAGDGNYTDNNDINAIKAIIEEIATTPLNTLNTHTETVQTVKESYREVVLTVNDAETATVPGTISITVNGSDAETVNNKFVPANATVSIFATANPGYRFVNWTRPAAQASAAARTAEARNSDVVSDQNPYTVTVSEALSLEANFEQIVVNVTLTDAQGNTYNVLLSDFTAEITKDAVADKLREAYPYITLGTTDQQGNVIDFGVLNIDGTAYTYTNRVELPFKVTNTTYIWHNIYYPSNNIVGSKPGCPNYIAALNEDEVVDMAASGGYYYGDNPTYNTKAGNPKISWAIYNVNNSFEFIFKSRVTGKYIKVESVVNATGNTQNVKFVENAEYATAFTLLKDAGSYNGDYALVAKVGDATGYLCAISSDEDYVTHFDRNNHQGAWVKFVEAPDYFSMIQDLGIMLGLKFGAGDGKYINTDAISEIDNHIANNSENITLNTIKQDSTVLNDAINSWPAVRLTINPVEGGTTNINGEAGVVHKYVPNEYELPLVAVPAEGYRFVSWTDGANEIETTEYTKTINGGKGDVIELTANFAINIYNISVTAGEGGSAMIGTETSTTVEHGSEVTLTAVENDGYEFVNWTKGTDVVSTDATYTFTATVDGEYVANFEFVGTQPTHYNITVNANISGEGIAFIQTGTSTDVTSGRYEAGSTITLNAVSDKDENGYLFTGWYVDDERISTEKTHTVTLSSDVTYTAMFEEGWRVRYSCNYRMGYIQVFNADGTEQIGGTNYVLVKKGSTIQMLGVAEETYQFKDWTANATGDFVSSDNPYILEVNSNMSFTANFEPKHYVLTVRANDESYGTVTAESGTFGPAESVKVGIGMTATITATAEEGHKFVNWTLGGNVVSTDATYTVPAINEVNNLVDVEYIANFLPVENATAGTYYRIAYDFPAPAAAGAARVVGETLTYTISPSTGTPNTNGGFFAYWVSNNNPQLRMDSKANSGNEHDRINTLSNGTKHSLVDGTGSGVVFTVSAPDGYMITSYSISGVAYGDITLNGSPISHNKSVSLSDSNLEVSSFSFTIVGGMNGTYKKGIDINLFEVTIVAAAPNTARYYMQSEACGVTNKTNALLMTQDGESASSIFYYDNNKLLSYKEGRYLDESNSARGLQAVGAAGGNVEIIDNKIKVSSGTTVVYLHANKNEGTSTTYFVDRCTSKDGSDNGDPEHNFIIEEVTTLPVTISSALHATFYAPVAVEIPEGVKAYVLKEKYITAGSYVTMTSLSSIIPANTGVILKSEEAKTYYFNITENTDEARAEAVGNILEGTVAKSIINKDAYMLAKKSNGVGMYPLSNNSYLTDGITPATFTNNSHKAYLPVEGNFATLLQQGVGFRFIYDDEETTGIDEFETELEDTIYDLQGRKLSEITEPGIYIVNGKKIFVK